MIAITLIISHPSVKTGTRLWLVASVIYGKIFVNDNDSNGLLMKRVLVVATLHLTPICFAYGNAAEC